MTLKDAVQRGLPFRPERGRRRTVRGGDLRALLMFCGARSGVTPAGIELDGGNERLITISAGDDGIVDLGDLKPCCGNGLPSMVIRNCVIQGTLRLAGSHFTALRVASSKVDAIDGAFCRVSCDLNLSGLSTISGGVSLRNAKVGGSLEVSDVAFAYPSRGAGPGYPHDPIADKAFVLDLNGIEADAIRLRRLGLYFVESELSNAPCATALFDLQGARCRVFDDDDARVWVGLGERTRWSVLLKGINLDVLDDSGGEQARAPVPSSDLGDNAALRSLRRRMMLMAFDGEAGGPKLYSKLVQAPAFSAQPHVVFAQAYSRAEERWIATEIATDRIELRWASAVSVIRQRVRERAILSVGMCVVVTAVIVGVYQYADVAAAINVGDLASLQWGRSLLWWIAGTTLAVSALWTSHLLVRIIGYLFGFIFAFGLKPQRAVVAMGIYLVVGVGVVSIAAAEGALKPSTGIGGSQHATGIDQPRWAGQAIAAVHQISAEGCNQASSNWIDRTIYALDVSIPVLDLRQECAFTFGSGPGWRFAKSLYELLGWVFVSLTLLSLSGVLRRDLEG